MAKEWDKFQADYKKLSPDIKNYSMAEASVVSTRVNTAKANCTEGEYYLADCAVKARKAGVTGTSLAEFIKNKDFKEGVALLDKATSMLTEAIRAFDAFSKKAGDVAEAVGKLGDAITKDLKSRKDSSASKKDIEALLDQTAADKKDLLKAAKYYSERVNKATLDYAGNFQKTVAKILNEAPEAQEKQKDDAEIPMLFVDRNLKKNFNAAVGLAKKVAEACDAAMEKAQDDLAGAIADLKAAAPHLASLKELNESYAKAVKTYSDALDISKDKAKVLKMVAAIAKAYENAERQLRGVATTMKKAG